MSAYLTPYASQLVATSAIAVVAALALYVTVLSGQLSVAHAALMGIGGYVSGLVGVDLHWPLGAALVGAGLISGGIGALLSALLARLRGFYLSIATLAFGETMVVLATNVPQLGGADGLSGIPLDTTLPVAVLSAALATYMVKRWESSRVGQATRAVGEDPTAAAAVGIDVRWIKISSFFLGGLLAGYAGAMNARYVGLVAPTDMNFQAEVVLFFYVGIGGMSTYAGAVVGAVVITILPELLRFSVYDRYLFFGLALAGMMVVRPYGLVVRAVGPSWIRARRGSPPADRGVPDAAVGRVERR